MWFQKKHCCSTKWPLFIAQKFWYNPDKSSNPAVAANFTRKPRVQHSSRCTGVVFMNYYITEQCLSEIAKSIKITLFAELLTVISPNYVQSLLNFSMKTLKHSIFSKKCPIHTKFFVAIYALFPQIF